MGLLNTSNFLSAAQVEFGVDELLFNLIILQSLVNSDGVVWQAKKSQYYVIECMPFIKQVKYSKQYFDFFFLNNKFAFL